MHTSNSKLNNSNILCRKELVQSGPRNINNFLASIILRTKSKLTSAAFSKNEDVEALGRGCVDDGKFFDGFRWLRGLGWLWSLGLRSGFGFRNFLNEIVSECATWSGKSRLTIGATFVAATTFSAAALRPRAFF